MAKKNAESLPSDQRSRRAKPAATKSNAIKHIGSTKDFYLDDFNRTLFPLNSNKILITNGEAEICEHIKKCLTEKSNAHSFMPQHRVYSAKSDLHLRRTVKLDIVAEYYIYDVIFRNRNLFRKPHSVGRAHYGYRFEDGAPISPTSAYRGFKGALADYQSQYSHFMSLDVSSYFNHVYHHDLVSWFLELGAEQDDVEGLGQLLRQTNSGRSVDCLPQGLYPTKMIGNDFLRFIDNHHALKSEKLVRFMDDIYLFSNNVQHIRDDFQKIQILLGEKGLSVNPSKTKHGLIAHIKFDTDIDKAKQSLLRRRRFFLTEGYDAEGDATASLNFSHS